MRNKRGCVVSTTTATPAPTWILSSWAFDRLRHGDLTAIQYIGFAATERGSASTTTTTTATATHQQHQHRHRHRNPQQQLQQHIATSTAAATTTPESPSCFDVVLFVIVVSFYCTHCYHFLLLCHHRS